MIINRKKEKELERGGVKGRWGKRERGGSCSDVRGVCVRKALVERESRSEREGERRRG